MTEHSRSIFRVLQRSGAQGHFLPRSFDASGCREEAIRLDDLGHLARYWHSQFSTAFGRTHSRCGWGIGFGQHQESQQIGEGVKVHPVPDKTFFSLNQVAKLVGMDRQEFRQLVAVFEGQVGHLPLQQNEEGKEVRCIPAAFVHVFEEAALWMAARNKGHSDAMAYTLSAHRLGALEQLSKAVNDRRPILMLPKHLEEQTNALIKAARTERPVSIRLLDQKALADAIYDLGQRAGLNRWLLVGVAVTSALLGSLAPIYIIGVNIDVLNTSQAQTTYQLMQIRKFLETKGRP